MEVMLRVLCCVFVGFTSSKPSGLFSWFCVFTFLQYAGAPTTTSVAFGGGGGEAEP